jgi:predicted CXXCH cytochrome family protein
MASRVHYLLGLLLLFLAIPSEILALRPYVTTDADVVDSGVLEIELGVAFVRNDLLD